MFLKNDKYDILSKLSIRTRLTLFYSLAAFILLTLLVFLLYWESIDILYRANYQFLADEVDTIQYILQNKSLNHDEIKHEIIEASTKPENSINHYYIRLINAAGNKIIESPGLSAILPLNKTITKLSDNANKTIYRWYFNKGTRYLITQAPIVLENNHPGIIQIALDVSYQHSVFNDHKIFIIAILASALCSLLLGFFITDKGIRSLYELTAAAEKITATSLHQRIDPKSWPKELETLGVAFNQMLDRIEASFVRLKQFSSDLAHELRIPINNLIGETEIALSPPHTIDEYQQVLISNLEEFHRITQMIENILFLSRAENPQIELQKTNIHVQDEILFICEYYQAMAEEKSIRISSDGNARLRFNLIMFRRMMNNLLSNALKNTPPGGQIHFNISSSPHQTNINISDNGIGIASEHLTKIFDRFYRVDTARSQQSGGVGLGLAIVKSIVDLHQGTIVITSELGKGTHVSLSFGNE